MAQALVAMLAPICPHWAEELYHLALGKNSSVYNEPWPQFDSSAAIADTVEIAVQVMGKVRGRIHIDVKATHDEIQQAACAEAEKYLKGKTIRNLLGGGLTGFAVYITTLQPVRELLQEQTGVNEPGTIMIPGRRQKHLRFMGKTTKCFTVQDAVAITLKTRAIPVLLSGVRTAFRLVSTRPQWPKPNMLMPFKFFTSARRN